MLTRILETDPFVGGEPAYSYFRDELTELMGSEAYGILVGYLDRPRATPLPHPAVRGRHDSRKNNNKKTRG